MKKLLDKNNPENTVVHIVIHASDNREYECVGVLFREEKDFIRVVFNAENDKVKDYLDIKRSEIMSIDILDSSKIKNL